MNITGKRVLFWTPRILGILFAIFVSMFAFDVFDQGYGVWRTILALLINLVPAYLVIIALIVAWQREWLGAILFIALAVLYVVWGWGRQSLVAYLVIAGPLILVGGLFLLNWKYKAELRTR